MLIAYAKKPSEATPLPWSFSSLPKTLSAYLSSFPSKFFIRNIRTLLLSYQLKITFESLLCDFCFVAKVQARAVWVKLDMLSHSMLQLEIGTSFIKQPLSSYFATEMMHAFSLMQGENKCIFERWKKVEQVGLTRSFRRIGPHTSQKQNNVK